MRRYGTQLKTYPNRTYDRLVAVNTELVKGERDYRFRALDTDGLAHVGEVISDGQCTCLAGLRTLMFNY